MDTLTVVKHYSVIGGGDRHGHFNCGEALLCDRREDRYGYFNYGEALLCDRREDRLGYCNYGKVLFRDRMGRQTWTL